MLVPDIRCATVYVCVQRRGIQAWKCMVSSRGCKINQRPNMVWEAFVYFYQICFNKLYKSVCCLISPQEIFYTGKPMCALFRYIYERPRCFTKLFPQSWACVTFLCYTCFAKWWLQWVICGHCMFGTMKQANCWLGPAWISNYIIYNVWDEITYPFLNFNGTTVEV